MKLNILVYGIEKKGLEPPSQFLETNSFKLFFEPFDTLKSFNEFDGVILFQGIFENFKRNYHFIDGISFNHFSYKDELDKRKKEVSLLLKKKGFVCFLLTEDFNEYDRYKEYKGADLVEFHLNMLGSNFYIKDFSNRVTIGLKSKTNEFMSFIDEFGAAYNYFEHYREDLEIKEIVKSGKALTGMLLFGNEFYIPSLIPSPEKLEKYFEILVDAITSTRKKLIIEIPQWVNSFEFESEILLKKENDDLIEKIENNQRRINEIESYKRILFNDGELLVEAVTQVLQKGFGFNIDAKDELKEDLKILDEDGKIRVLVEIKGTNKGVKREYINQTDSHRERASFPETFPTLLIINTNCKKSRTIEEKNVEVAQEQVLHAKKMNVLIIRTLDLLELLRQLIDEKVTNEDCLKIFQEKAGWLKVTSEKLEIVSC
jgi:hypothetical protein